MEWPNLHDEDSESNDPPLSSELLFVEQNVRRALRANLEETNNWPSSADRIQFVYNCWVDQGRPSASAINPLRNRVTVFPSRAAAAVVAVPTTPHHAPHLTTRHPSVAPSVPPSNHVPESHSSHTGVRASNRLEKNGNSESDDEMEEVDQSELQSGRQDEAEEEEEEDEGAVDKDGDSDALELKIKHAKQSILQYKGFLEDANDRDTTALFRTAIKKKEAQLAELTKRRDGISSTGKVRQYSRLIGEKRDRAMLVVQNARKLLHDFAIAENVDLTAMHELLQGALKTALKTSSWDCWQHIKGVVRSGTRAFLLASQLL